MLAKKVGRQTIVPSFLCVGVGSFDPGSYTVQMNGLMNPSERCPYIIKCWKSCDCRSTYDDAHKYCVMDDYWYQLCTSSDRLVHLFV